MFKVLFVSSGNSEKGISPIVKNQGDSLKNKGLDVDFFSIMGKGLKGYLKNIVPLRNHTRKQTYDIIHAHYSLSGFIATLAGCSPLVVSLMGSDVQAGLIVRQAIKASSIFFWHGLILKSEDMRNRIGSLNNEIIPNGVNIFKFQAVDKISAINQLGWNIRKRHILFAADTSLPVKNFLLLQKAFEIIAFSEKIDMHTMEKIPHQEVPIYMNASDVVVLTSLWEGSPNVIKEAMACNRPIVATDVGDVSWVFGDTPGCYIASFDPADVAAKLKKALEFSEQQHQTCGRKRIIELGLDSESIARRIISVYESVIKSA